jgi:hypothetical protein
MVFSMLVLNFMGCNQDTAMNAFQDESDMNSGILEKKIKTSSTTTPTGDYPQHGSCDVKFFPNWGAYNGGLINIPNGSQFSFLYGALTPPSSYNMGTKVTIDMKVELDGLNQELVYTFGPSGCQFDPAADIWLSWKDLSGSGIPNLYLIDDNGNYHLQTPAEIDVNGKTLRIRIPHFSRYAVAFSQ